MFGAQQQLLKSEVEAYTTIFFFFFEWSICFRAGGLEGRSVGIKSFKQAVMHSNREVFGLVLHGSNEFFFNLYVDFLCEVLCKLRRKDDYRRKLKMLC